MPAKSSPAPLAPPPERSWSFVVGQISPKGREVVVVYPEPSQPPPTGGNAA